MKCAVLLGMARKSEQRHTKRASCAKGPLYVGQEAIRTSPRATRNKRLVGILGKHHAARFIYILDNGA